MSKEKPENPVEKPTKVGSSRILRGGDWYDFPSNVESAFRNGSNPSGRISNLGFRVARTKK